MSDITNSAINYHAYNVRKDDSLINQVGKLICVVLPRGLMVAGFSEKGELLMIRYGDYAKTLPSWIHDFYEHRFTDEPLLSKPDNVIATFVATDKNLIIPDALYDESEAMQWMNRIFFVEGNEVVSVHRIAEDAAKYVFTYPGTVKSIVGRHFSNAKLLPLAAFQFYKPFKTGSIVQCAITPEHVYATLYSDRALKWHQVFTYENGEDIAYQIKLLCQQQNISPDTLDIHFASIYRGLNPIVNSISQYFPHMMTTEESVLSHHGEWASTISMLQQLYECAS